MIGVSQVLTLKGGRLKNVETAVENTMRERFLQKGSLSHFTVITRWEISPASRGVRRELRSIWRHRLVEEAECIRRVS
jgi:hypothetical protein